MKHIHIALLLLVCSFVTLASTKNTLVYRRHYRRRPSNRKVQQNVVEIVEVFKTNRRPPAFMRSDKSIENFLLCDARCEKKRFLRRRKICLRTGRFCKSRPNGSKPETTTQINVSTRPVYKKPTVYQQNPYGNQNPDYTHLYPWSRPSVTVTKYQPDGRKEFNMTIVEVNNDTIATTSKYDAEYYDYNDDRYQQRRSTTFRTPTWEVTTLKTSTMDSLEPETTTATAIISTEPPETTESLVLSTTVTAAPITTTISTTTGQPQELITTTFSTTTDFIPTTTIAAPIETTKTSIPTTTAEPITSTLATTTGIISTTTEYWTEVTNNPVPVNLTESTAEQSLPAPSTPTTIFDTTTTAPITEIPYETTTSTTTELLLQPITTQSPSTSTSEVSQTKIQTTEATGVEDPDYVYPEGEDDDEVGEDEEGAEEEGDGQDEGENGRADGDVYDYDDDGNYAYEETEE